MVFLTGLKMHIPGRPDYCNRLPETTDRPDSISRTRRNNRLDRIILSSAVFRKYKVGQTP